ncbi:MAG: hypothetical protein FWG98_00080 [Candidatus Cloacimonetes bacterium]|nr:hypothetical protein [Candidatus Cloacimonadota bacterium]
MIDRTKACKSLTIRGNEFYCGKYNEELPYLVSEYNTLPCRDIERPGFSCFIEDSREMGRRMSASEKSGCYIATCVYGSYDSPEVWTLRRYRDDVLMRSLLGRSFISVYYAISPSLVRFLGEKQWFHSLLKPMLDKIVQKLSK